MIGSVNIWLQASAMPKHFRGVDFGDKLVCDTMKKQSTGDEITRLDARALGGPEEFTGRSFILANLKVVQNPDFWRHGNNIGLVVNCIGKRAGPGGTDRLPDAAGRPQQVFINVMQSDALTVPFNTTCQSTKETFKRKKDVLVHCRLTFHRGPVICAGIYQEICGVPYKVEGC